MYNIHKFYSQLQKGVIIWFKEKEEGLKYLDKGLNVINHVNLFQRIVNQTLMIGFVFCFGNNTN